MSDAPQSPQSPRSDRPPVDPAARKERSDPNGRGSPDYGTKNEIWQEGKPGAKPEDKPKGDGGGKPGAKPEDKPKGDGGGKPGAKPPGQTPKEWTGPRTPGGKPAPSKPTGDYDVPTHRIVRWKGEPAPREGSRSGGTSPKDRARAQGAGERHGPPGHKWDAGHEKPASRTPPGERPYLRPEGSSENRSGGKSIADQNQVRRQDSTHRDPSSPNYTREPKSRGSGEPRSPEPKPKSPEPKSPEPKPKSPEPKSPEPKPKSPEPKSPEPHVPGGPKGSGGPGLIEGAAGRLGPLGIIGDIQMIRDVAQEIEWRDNPSDPKWGNERTDMFGETWYRSEIDKGTWTTKPMPSA